jgi:hypothetical protein
MRFINLTDLVGYPVTINLDFVAFFHHDAKGTAVYGGRGAPELLVTVKESTHTIAAWIKEWMKETNAT